MSRPVLLAIILSVLPAFASATELSGRVVAISDGDTFTLLTGEKNQIKVRMDSIDAPEKNQPHGNAARQALAGKVFQQNVSVKVNTTDRYGRTVGTVMLNERNINRELVAEGHAWAYRQYLKDRYMIQAEESARSEKLGLWRLQKDQIQAPWEWRKSGGLKDRPAVADSIENRPLSLGYRCGQKQYCKEMNDCEEARFFLHTCRVTTIDGDGDGVPCESLCK